MKCQASVVTEWLRSRFVVEVSKSLPAMGAPFPFALIGSPCANCWRLSRTGGDSGEELATETCEKPTKSDANAESLILYNGISHNCDYYCMRSNAWLPVSLNAGIKKLDEKKRKARSLMHNRELFAKPRRNCSWS